MSGSWPLLLNVDGFLLEEALAVICSFDLSESLQIRIWPSLRVYLLFTVKRVLA
jgi:hypothetical protein